MATEEQYAISQGTRPGLGTSPGLWLMAATVATVWPGPCYFLVPLCVCTHVYSQLHTQVNTSCSGKMNPEGGMETPPLHSVQSPQTLGRGWELRSSQLARPLPHPHLSGGKTVGQTDGTSRLHCGFPSAHHPPSPAWFETQSPCVDLESDREYGAPPSTPTPRPARQLLNVLSPAAPRGSPALPSDRANTSGLKPLD